MSGTQATLLVDAAGSATLSTTAVVPVLNGAVTGSGSAIAAQSTLSDLATFFGTLPIPATFTSVTFSTQVISVTPFATPAALVATTHVEFASTASGASIMGFGTTNDVTLKNRAGTDVLGITANTVNVTMAGTLDTLGAMTVTSTSATAFAVGRIVGTGAAFSVDASAGTQALGLKVKGATSAGTVAISCVSAGGSNGNLTIDAKLAGNIGIGTISAGSITLGVAATGTSLVVIDGTGYGAGVASLRLNGLTSGAAAQLGTLTNAPTAGNPNFWIPVNVAGTVRYIPAW